MPDGVFKNSKKNGVFYGSYTSKDGKRKQFSTRTTVEREARKVFRDKLQAIWEEEDRPKLRIISLGDFTEEYLASRRGEKISTGQLKELSQSLSFLRRVVGDVPLHTITVQQCERFVTRGWRAKGWGSLYSAKKHYQNLSAAFKAAVRWGHVRTNPFDQIKKPKPIERMPEILTRRELSLLFDSLPDDNYFERRLRNFVLLAVNTGLRHSEILHMERRWIDFQAGEIRVPVKRDWTPKGRKPRVVPLSDDAVRALRSQLAENTRNGNEHVQSSSYIFPNPHGFPLSLRTLEKPFKEKVMELFPGRDLHPHSLRHTYASFLVERGVPLTDIQRILGHSTIQMTEKYARLRGNDFSRALEALNAVPSLVRASYTTPEAFEESVPVWEETA